jgi:hypothetical protein
MCRDMKTLSWDRGYDNVLLGQDYRTPHGAVADGYGAMAERRLAAENRSTRTKACFSVISSTTTLT